MREREDGVDAPQPNIIRDFLQGNQQCKTVYIPLRRLLTYLLTYLLTMSNSTTTNPCTNLTTSLTSPRNPSRTAYTAIGPIYNFTTAASYCCPNNGTVSHYAGGDGPSQCYWMCSFNGTREEMDRAMSCNSGAAVERNAQEGRRGWVGIGWHPDMESGSGADVGGGRVGVWKGVVLGLLVCGVVMGV